MEEAQLLAHLFRHQYGKMVSILTRIFGLTHLETIEDAVQDTFISAMVKWRQKMPDNPEAWLTQAAKNRAVDLMRKIKSDRGRLEKLSSGQTAMALHNVFLDHEIEDSQLRMIFIACHPQLKPVDQIAFALKTISGFSTREISSALLTKEGSIIKRLTRARKSIKENAITFQFPEKHDIPQRLNRVLEVLYLIFNEGFHSGKKELLIRKDLCGEALRLCQMILKKEQFRNGSAYALFALMCFQVARLESRVNTKNEIVDLKNQDRTKWDASLIQLGGNALTKAMDYDDVSSFHLEAMIVHEHLKAGTFAMTDWEKILHLYQKLNEIDSSEITSLNIAVVLLELERFEEAHRLLQKIDANSLEQRAYLYYGTLAEYYTRTGDVDRAIKFLDKALTMVTNAAERDYLKMKRNKLAIEDEGRS